MVVLGISCFYHNAAAAIIKDGILIAAIQEERLTRIKNDPSFPKRAIKFCLGKANLRLDEIDAVAFYERPLLKLSRTWKVLVKNFPHSHALARTLKETGERQLSVRNVIRNNLGLKSDQIYFIPHHLSHAASSFLCSGIDDAAIVTVDGVGEWTTATIGKGSINSDRTGNISIIKELNFPHSLGLCYSAFTQFCGFEVNEGEYKLMGLAPYGDPQYTEKVREVINVANDGSFRLNMDYFSFLSSRKYTYSKKFLSLFGEPNSGKDIEIPQRYADIAASIQQVTEETLLSICAEAKNTTNSKRLCLAGGVALNSVANGRIAREGDFDQLFIQPASDDAGGALGAALYTSTVLLGVPNNFEMSHAYWGSEYSDSEILNHFTNSGVKPDIYQSDSLLSEFIASALTKGNVIGFMQGRSEWGPRALGARSIIADPRRADIKDKINSMVKYRESFRPFAPAILSEYSTEYFDYSPYVDAKSASFMQTVHPFKQGKARLLEATNHCGTGRLQVVDEWSQHRYRKVIESFHERTGVPAVINTSFNVKGEPMVETAQDALRTFRNSGMDLLIAGNTAIWKHKPKMKYVNGIDTANLSTTENKLSNSSETLQSVYEIAPQFRDYHALEKCFQPYTSISQLPNFNSQSVNTDSSGHRISINNGRPYDWKEWMNFKHRGLILGGSTAFGQGATSDVFTISSTLNSITRNSFLNLGIPGCTSGQEAVVSLPFLNQANTVVIVSGVNTLYTILRFGNFTGTPYTPLLMSGLANGLSRYPIQKVYQKCIGRLDEDLSPFGSVMKSVPVTSEEALTIASEHQKRDLRVIKQVANHSAQVYFCAQPLSLLCKGTLTQEEETLHELLIDAKNTKLSETMIELVRIWPKYKIHLKQICIDLNVNFIDLEQIDYPGWCFFDHVHLTDNGNKICAEYIGEHVQ